MANDWISTKTAMDLLGVGSTTIKRWADKGIVPSIRTVGGHRRFSRSALLSLYHSRQAPATDTDSVDQWVDLAFGTNSVPQLVDKFVDTRSSYTDWFDCAEFFGNVIKRIGDRWEAGDYGIAEEHLISSRLQRAMTNTMDTMPLPDDPPVCLLATLTGERHLLGLALVGLCLREAGHDIYWVGSDTPPDDLADLVLKLKPAVVALSASSWLNDRRFLAKSQERLSGACRKLDTILLLGGTAPWPDNPDFGYRCATFAELKRVLSGRKEYTI